MMARMSPLQAAMCLALVASPLARAQRPPEEVESVRAAVAEDECEAGAEIRCAVGMLQRRAQRQAPSAEQTTATDAASCFDRPVPGGLGASELCFCQLAKNPSCLASPCACPQGCVGTTWEVSNLTVSFRNTAQAQACPDSTVVLTSPKGYFRDPLDLSLSTEGSCTATVIQQLLADSWSVYQSFVGQGPVWQCFHGYHIASVKYLHLQTFCRQGTFHGMPTQNAYVASCLEMTAASEAPALAATFVGMLRG